jgi:hypothetical protein
MPYSDKSASAFEICFDCMYKETHTHYWWLAAAQAGKQEIVRP